MCSTSSRTISACRVRRRSFAFGADLAASSSPASTAPRSGADIPSKRAGSETRKSRVSGDSGAALAPAKKAASSGGSSAWDRGGPRAAGKGMAGESGKSAAAAAAARSGTSGEASGTVPAAANNGFGSGLSAGASVPAPGRDEFKASEGSGPWLTPEVCSPPTRGRRSPPTGAAPARLAIAAEQGEAEAQTKARSQPMFILGKDSLNRPL